MSADVRPATMPPQVQSWKLIAILGGAGAFAGFLIVLAYIWTLPAILEHRAGALRGAIEEVLRQPAGADTLFLVNGALATTMPAGAKPEAVERVYRGRDAESRTVGYAVVASEAGFADQIVVMFGWNPANGQLLGIRILSSKETPGLGDKIERASFTGQFPGATTPLTGVKDQAAKSGKTGAIVMITGATISSRTIIREINNAVARWQPLIVAFEAREGR